MPNPLVVTFVLYHLLNQEGKAQLLNAAVGEIGKMLKDNLYVKFRISAEYNKHIQDQLSALEEVGG